MIPRSKGRLPSLLAWGLLVGGVALLMTLPASGPPTELRLAHVPAAILYILAGVVFGLSHPEGRAWLDGALLGWVPLLTALAMLFIGDVTPPPIVLTTVSLAPALLAAGAAAAGAAWARRRNRAAR